MSRQLDKAGEDRQRRRYDAVVSALEFGMLRGLENQGASLTGFSVKYGEWECLMTLRATVEGVHQVSFVGAEDMVGLFVKVARVVKNGDLRWKADRFAE